MSKYQICEVDGEGYRTLATETSYRHAKQLAVDFERRNKREYVVMDADGVLYRVGNGRNELCVKGIECEIAEEQQEKIECSEWGDPEARLQKTFDRLAEVSARAKGDGYPRIVIITEDSVKLHGIYADMNQASGYFAQLITPAMGPVSDMGCECQLIDGEGNVKLSGHVGCIYFAKEEPQGIHAVLAERGANYGRFEDQATISQILECILRGDFQDAIILLSQDDGTDPYKAARLSEHLKNKWHHMTASQREALKIIVHKQARIVNGNPNHTDSWVDIAGYATLEADRQKGKSI